MKYFDKIKYIGMLCLMPLALVGCSDTWDAHYNGGGQEMKADKTLWEEIDARPELEEFARMLELYGYDKMLDGDQMFTVFAPIGEIDTLGLTKEKVKTEVIENHIARFVHSANGTMKSKDVVMLNTKMVNFTATATGAMFGRTELTEQYNIIAKNGVLHVIAAQQPFFHNIWEYLTTDTLYDSIRTYLYSFNKEYLDENASVKGDIVNGKQEYEDSVVITSNEMFYRIGQLNNEDSTYSMILPTNAAWREAYPRISAYYNYPRAKAGRDSLKRLYTGLAMVGDLVFSHTVQKDPQQALVSTYPAYYAKDLHVFENPFENILYGYNSWSEGGYECSNGRVFKVDSLGHKPWQSWHSRLQVEGENLNVIKVTETTTKEPMRRALPYTDSLYTKTSSGAYVEISAASMGVQPTMSYKIWNTLAGKYDVKIVFLPQSLATDVRTANNMKPNTFKVLCSYRRMDGTMSPSDNTAVIHKGSHKNDPYVIDTVDVGTITLPVCSYGDEVAGVELTIASNINPQLVKKGNWSTTFLIDCIILEPSKE